MTDAPRTAQRLTIVLPLKGRALFTLRFLWHANKVRLPYRFLIADGQVDPVLAELLEMPHVLFPNIDVEYIYILSDWFKHSAYKDTLDYIISVGCHYYFEILPLNKLGLPMPK